jgi:hypothetical protein
VVSRYDRERVVSMSRASLTDVTGATLIRFEMADGCRYNVDDDEARNRIGFGDLKFRAMPGAVTGDMVVPYLYAVSRLDPSRFVFELPSTMTGTGSTRVGAGQTSGAGSREGFIFQRGETGKAEGNPVGKVIFMTYDRRFREGDPTDRRDFERMG